MPLIQPFAGLRPRAEHTDAVLAPPYDVLNSTEAKQRAVGKPWSFLHISKPEIDLPEDTDPFAPEVYAKARENLDNMLAANILVTDKKAVYYVYALQMGEHHQIGLVAAASVADYDTNRIRKHEFTRPDKEDDRVRQIEALDAQTGPVFLTYKYDAEVQAVLDRVATSAAEVDVTADDGIRHRLWLMQEDADIALISQRFDAMPSIYIADGHHRSAAASRVAAARQQSNPTHSGSEPYNYFLSVLFPDTQMKILDYNRVVSDLNGLNDTEFLAKVAERFDVNRSAVAVKPVQAGEYGLYLSGQWYKLNIHPEQIPADPVGRLDVSLLANNLIDPILGISDPRRDKRIDFVGGIRGLAGLEKRVDSGDMRVAFSLYPTAMADLMAVADAGEVMPPKSTWFEPKLADGLVSHWLAK